MSERTPVMDAWYSPRVLAVLLGFTSGWVVARINAGDFGPDCIKIDSDYRIPASAVNAFLARHRLRMKDAPGPVFARSTGELRRKISESKRLDEE